MKAFINRNFKESITGGDGLLITFYLMMGGKKDPKNVKELYLIKDDMESSDILRIFETINKYNNKIEREKKGGISNPSEEIKLDLEVIKNILFYSYELLNDAKSSWKETFGGDAPEEYFFIARMGYTHWGMCVIELSKLFTNSPHQQFNLFSLLNKIDAYKKIEGVTAQVKNIDTEKYRTSMNEFKDEAILDKLIQERNKVFAHTDKVIFEGTLKFDLDYLLLERLQKIAFDILKEMNLTLFNQNLEKHIPNAAVDSILKLLNKEIKGIPT